MACLRRRVQANPVSVLKQVFKFTERSECGIWPAPIPMTYMYRHAHMVI